MKEGTGEQGEKEALPEVVREREISFRYTLKGKKETPGWT